MSLAYDTDFYAWTQDQADALARRSANELDWDNLSEEIDSLGRELTHALESALEIVIHHWLKWTYQPQLRSRRWVLSIREHRRRVERRLADSPSLRARLPELYREAYKTARITATQETGLDEAVFPDQPPFDVDFALHEPIEWTAPGPQRRSRTRKTNA